MIKNTVITDKVLSVYYKREVKITEFYIKVIDAIDQYSIDKRRAFVLMKITDLMETTAVQKALSVRFFQTSNEMRCK